MEKVLSIMKALSDANRLRIVSALMAFDELCACQITELLQVSGATVSRHLALLVNAEVLESRRAAFCLGLLPVRPWSWFEGIWPGAMTV